MKEKGPLLVHNVIHSIRNNTVKYQISYVLDYGIYFYIYRGLFFLKCPMVGG